MKKWNFIIDVEKCEDCNNCFLACKDEHVDNEWPGVTSAQPRHGHRWMNIMRKERGTFPLIDVAYRPTPCMHCDNAPCIAATADSQAIYKRQDGIVLIDPVKAEGKKELVASCPYGAIFWNEESLVPQKCTFCAHLLDSGWAQPRCSQVCPTGALTAVKIDDSEMEALIQNQELKTLHPEYKTSPRVYYKNLFRFDRCFIAGSVSVNVDGVIDCVHGARVTLKKENTVVSQVNTSPFGEYKFDKLRPDQGEFQLEITYGQFEKKIISVKIDNSLTLPDMVFM